MRQSILTLGTLVRVYMWSVTVGDSPASSEKITCMGDRWCMGRSFYTFIQCEIPIAPSTVRISAMVALTVAHSPIVYSTVDSNDICNGRLFHTVALKVDVACLSPCPGVTVSERVETVSVI